MQEPGVGFEDAAECAGLDHPSHALHGRKERKLRRAPDEGGFFHGPQDRRVGREIDLVARIGGEEFLVLCDNSDLQATHSIAERMRIAVEQMIMPFGEIKSLQVTVSGGVYASVPETDDLSTWLSRVDVALYDAKSAGRNKVIHWEMQ